MRPCLDERLAFATSSHSPPAIHWRDCHGRWIARYAAQREVVQRVFRRIVITDDRVTEVDVYPIYAEALRWLLATPSGFGRI